MTEEKVVELFKYRHQKRKTSVSIAEVSERIQMFVETSVVFVAPDMTDALRRRGFSLIDLHRMLRSAKGLIPDTIRKDSHYRLEVFNEKGAGHSILIRVLDDRLEVIDLL